MASLHLLHYAAGLKALLVVMILAGVVRYGQAEDTYEAVMTFDVGLPVKKA